MYTNDFHACTMMIHVTHNNMHAMVKQATCFVDYGKQQAAEEYNNDWYVGLFVLSLLFTTSKSRDIRDIHKKKKKKEYRSDLIFC